MLSFNFVVMLRIKLRYESSSSQWRRQSGHGRVGQELTGLTTPPFAGGSFNGGVRFAQLLDEILFDRQSFILSRLVFGAGDIIGGLHQTVDVNGRLSVWLEISPQCSDGF